MQTFLHDLGTRVTIRRGAFPLDAALVGRTGLIVALTGYRPKRYSVTLEGESEPRDFTEDELAPTSEAAAGAHAAAGDPGPGVGPTPSGGTSGAP